MDINIGDVIPIIGVTITMFGLWYKINQDTDQKITAAKTAAKADLDRLIEDVSVLKVTAISRAEHDVDVQNLKAEIRGFRDEIREDIRGLNVNLTSRFDLMMQRLFDVSHATEKTKKNEN